MQLRTIREFIIRGHCIVGILSEKQIKPVFGL